MLLASLWGSVGGASAAPSPGPLYNLQVSVQTQSPLPDYFVVSAYNSTGALLTTSQSQYPAGSLQLPSGTYLLTAAASKESSYYQPYPVSAGGASPAVCCVYSQPLVEYGYVVAQVSSSTSMTIKTANASGMPTSTVTIHATLPNGTAAKGASVSASVLGNWYWGYGTRSVSMYNMTDSSGTATLVTPDVPVLVSVWASLPVNLPTNLTTIQRTIAGEKVNVTVYWQPSYVSFGGWSLLTPPQRSSSVVLHYEQPQYYVTPYAVAKDASAGGAFPGVPSTPASSSAYQASTVYPGFGPGGILAPSGPSQSSQSAQTVYMNTGTVSTTTLTVSSSTGGGSNLLVYAAVGFAAALGAAVAVVAVVAMGSLRRPS